MEIDDGPGLRNDEYMSIRLNAKGCVQNAVKCAGSAARRTVNLLLLVKVDEFKIVGSISEKKKTIRAGNNNRSYIFRVPNRCDLLRETNYVKHFFFWVEFFGKDTFRKYILRSAQNQKA